MSSSALSLFVGPAVVVDDEVDQANTTARAVVAELEDAHFPVLRRRVIPSDEGSSPLAGDVADRS